MQREIRKISINRLLSGTKNEVMNSSRQLKTVKRTKVNPIAVSNNIKSKKGYENVIVLLRDNQDSYLIFGEDANKVAPVLTLPIFTDEETNLPKVSFFYTLLDTYLPKLVRAGHRIAICDLYE